MQSTLTFLIHSRSFTQCLLVTSLFIYCFLSATLQLPQFSCKFFSRSEKRLRPREEKRKESTHSEIQRVFISLSRASHQFISISFFVALPIKNTVSHADKFFVTSEYTDLYLLLMSAVMRTSTSEQKELTELTELFLSTLYIVFIVSQKVFFIQK